MLRKVLTIIVAFVLVFSCTPIAFATGDKVLAENPETGESEYKEVVKVFENETNELVHLTVNGETITATPAHPFYVPQRGWISAIDLKAGDILVLSNGEYVTVEQVQHEILETPVKVYNFEVHDFHTYYVGENSVLVHNLGCGDSKGKTLNEWLADEPELLDECTRWYNEKPEWWGIDPNTTDVYYRTQQEVKVIRNKTGESGGHHPHGLALGGPEGQTLTITGKTAKIKNPMHSQVTGLQRRVINIIKKQL